MSKRDTRRKRARWRQRQRSFRVWVDECVGFKSRDWRRVANLIRQSGGRLDLGIQPQHGGVADIGPSGEIRIGWL